MRWSAMAAAMLACVVPAHAYGAQAVQAMEADTPRILFHVPSGSFDNALNALATQARIQILYSSALVANRRTSGVQGRLTSHQALASLLRDTGLTAIPVNNNTYLLQEAPREKQRQRRLAKPDVPATTPAVPDPLELPAVTVTGTHIPRTTLETSTPITLITSEQIESSGYGTLFDVLRQQPGMIGHHPVDVSSEGGLSFQPNVVAAATSLYSLGPRATLFLIDGHRMASYGLASADLGGLSDLNGIPLSIIDRIEILRGGASAIYGADAMAGVVNIILKKDFSGTEINMRYGISERGDAGFHRLSASFGTRTRHGGDVFLSADSMSRDELRGDQRDWHTQDQRRFGLADNRTRLGYWGIDGTVGPLQSCIDAGLDDNSPYCQLDVERYRSLQPRIESKLVYGYWRQPIGDSMNVYASGRMTRIDQHLQAAPMWGQMPLTPTHPDWHNGDSLIYAFHDIGPARNRSRTDVHDVTLGSSGLAGDWNWDINLSHSSNRVANAIDGTLRMSGLGEIADGTHTYRFDGTKNSDEVLALLSPTLLFRGTNSLDSLDARIDGSLFSMPAGEARIAAGLELRQERLVNRPDPLLADNGISLSGENMPRDVRRDHGAFYAEVNLPLHRNLQADLAWRIDHDQGYGSGASPKLALKWNLGPHLMLRGSVGEGYRAPTLYELRQPVSPNSQVTFVPAVAPYLPCRDDYYVDENNEGLCLVEIGSMENSDLHAETSRSSNLGLVWAPNDAFNLSLDHYRVVRHNEYLVVDPFLQPELALKGLTRDENGLLYRVNSYLDGIGQSDTRGWEFDTEYLLPSQRLGRFAFRLGGHYQERMVRQESPQSPGVEFAGYAGPRFSALGSVQWLIKDWATTLNMRHFGASHTYPADTSCPQPNLDAGKCRNPSATLWGLDIAYTGIARWTMSLNVNNLTDRAPVNYDQALGGYSIVNDDPFGRYYVVSLAYRF